MFDELKKKSFKSSIFATIILLALGIALVVLNLNNARYALFGYEKFTTLAPEEIKKGQLVDVEIIENFGCFMERYEKNTETGSTHTTSLYYVIYTGDPEDNESPFKYMAIRVQPRKEKQLEAMAEATYEGYWSEPMQFSGKIKPLKDEEYDYFCEYWEAAGLSRAEIEEYTLPYYIKTYSNKTAMSVFYTLLFVGGIALIVWSVLRFVKGKNGGYLKKFYKTFTDAGVSEATAAADFNASEVLTKKNTIRIGRLFTYYDLNTAIPKAVANQRIEWAYQSTTTHRTNGIKTGTTYSIVAYIEGTKRTCVTINVPNEEAAQRILGVFGQRFPWILLGYTEDIKKLYFNNYAEFSAKRKEIMASVQFDEFRQPAESGFTENNTQNS